MKESKHRQLFWAAVVIGLVLFVLIIRPYPPGEYQPVILGVFPAPFFYFVLFTTLFTLYVTWIAFVWNPYHWLEKYAEKEVDE